MSNMRDFIKYTNNIKHSLILIIIVDKDWDAEECTEGIKMIFVLTIAIIVMSSIISVSRNLVLGQWEYG